MKIERIIKHLFKPVPTLMLLRNIMQIKVQLFVFIVSNYNYQLLVWYLYFTADLKNHTHYCFIT